MTRLHVSLPEFLEDPFGSLARARAEGGLADFGLALGVVGYDDVRTLLTDSTRLRADFATFLQNLGISSGAFYDWMAMSPLNKDGAEHLRWRALMSRTFTPRRVEQLRPFLRRAAHELIDGFAGRGACEFMAEFADAYPSLGLCELIGVPIADRDRFRGWANTIGLGFNPVELAERIADVDAALIALVDYTGELAEMRRKDPQDDLVTRIAQAAHEDGWSTDEVRGFIAGLVFAGHETTKNQLGWTVAVLSTLPEVWDGVAADGASAADVVEEVLRLRSTVTAVGRTVVEPIEFRGEEIAPGTPLLLSLWGADHDTAAFPHAERFDLPAHRDAPHVAFGHGPHHCLGAALARAELQEGLAALSSRLTRPAIGAGAAWRPSAGITGPIELPITFAARPA